MGIYAIVMLVIEGITLAISEAAAYGVEDIISAEETACVKGRLQNPINASSLLYAVSIDGKRKIDPWATQKKGGMWYHGNTGYKTATEVERLMKQCGVNLLGILKVKRGIYKKFGNLWAAKEMDIEVKKVQAYELKKAKMLADLAAKKAGKGKGKKGDTMEKVGAAVGSIDPKIWMAAGGTLALIIYLRSRKK